MNPVWFTLLHSFKESSQSLMHLSTLRWSFTLHLEGAMKCGINIVLCVLCDFFCSSPLIFNPEMFLAPWQTWVGWLVTPVWCMVHCVMEPLLSSLRVLPLIPTVVCTLSATHAIIHLTPHASAQSSILSLASRAILGDDWSAEDHTPVHNSNCYEVSDESWRWACWQIQPLITESSWSR